MSEPYAIALASQLAAFRARVATGMKRRGWKVGINVPEIRATLGLEHALVGWLDGDRILPNGATIPLPTGSRFHVEPELCLRLAEPVDAGGDLAAARSAVDAIAPALEIVDYAKPANSLDAVVEHSMFHSACVLGEWRAVPHAGAIGIAERVRLRVGARESEWARADLVPQDIAEIVVLVARVLSEAGERLLAGDLILSGSFTAKAVPLEPGKTAIAELGLFGVVRCALAAQPGVAAGSSLR
jgi:2-keto-4-pentenoate hydratase